MSAKTIVWVSVEGGIAQAGVAQGDATILMWDWDVIDETTEPTEIEAMIAQAEQLPDSHAEKAAILTAMHEALDTLREENAR